MFSKCTDVYTSGHYCWPSHSWHGLLTSARRARVCWHLAGVRWALLGQWGCAQTWGCWSPPCSTATDQRKEGTTVTELPTDIFSQTLNEKQVGKQLVACNPCNRNNLSSRQTNTSSAQVNVFFAKWCFYKKKFFLLKFSFQLCSIAV